MKGIEGFCVRGETGVYAENALNTVPEQITLRAMPLRGRPFTEVGNMLLEQALEEKRSADAKAIEAFGGGNPAGV